MGARMFVEHGKHLIAQFLVEARRLKTERAEHHMVAATDTGFLFGSLYELRTDLVPSQGLMDPDGLNVTAATPGPALETCLDSLLIIAEKNRQPLPVIDPCACSVIDVELMFQVLHVFHRWTIFDAQMRGVHHPLLVPDPDSSF